MWRRPIAAGSGVTPDAVGGHPDMPAGGHEEDLMAITERDRIRWSMHRHAAPTEYAS